MIGNLLLHLSKFYYHHFTFHGDICYFAYIVSPYRNHTCRVISLFEVNLISKVYTTTNKQNSSCFYRILNYFFTNRVDYTLV